MPESVFQQIATAILRLHRYNPRSWLAFGDGNHTDIGSRPYTNIDGNYYFWLNNAENGKAASTKNGQAAVMLIEDELRQSNITWIGTARTVSRKEAVFQTACEAICRHTHHCREKHGCLIELIPAQGQLTLGRMEKLSVSPQHLKRALFPAQERLASWAT